MYYIYYDTAIVHFPHDYNVSSTSTSCTVTGLNAGTTYYFWVSAVIDSTESPKSDYVCATPIHSFKVITPSKSSYVLSGISFSIYTVFDGPITDYRSEVYIDDKWVPALSFTGCNQFTSSSDTQKMVTIEFPSYLSEKLPFKYRIAVTMYDGTVNYTDEIPVNCIDDADITIQIADSLSLQQCVDYVNNFTLKMDKITVLNEGQMRIIERVLGD